MKLTQKVPIYLVEKQALNQAMGAEQHVRYETSYIQGHLLSVIGFIY